MVWWVQTSVERWWWDVLASIDAAEGLMLSVREKSFVPDQVFSWKEFTDLKLLGVMLAGVVVFNLCWQCSGRSTEGWVAKLSDGQGCLLLKLRFAPAKDRYVFSFALYSLSLQARDNPIELLFCNVGTCMHLFYAETVIEFRILKITLYIYIQFSS